MAAIPFTPATGRRLPLDDTPGVDAPDVVAALLRGVREVAEDEQASSIHFLFCTDAEKEVKTIEGVEGVTNNIKVLPLSPADDRIRRAEYRAIYGQSALFRYAEQAVPPIHIIVENGHVTLEGYVDTAADKTLAEIAAKGVPGVFSVTDNLEVVAPPKH